MPKDIIKQIFTNEPSDWAVLDTMAFQFYDCEVQGIMYSRIAIIFDRGVVECYDNDNKVVKTFELTATLSPIELSI